MTVIFDYVLRQSQKTCITEDIDIYKIFKELDRNVSSMSVKRNSPV